MWTLNTLTSSIPTANWCRWRATWASRLGETLTPDPSPTQAGRGEKLIVRSNEVGKIEYDAQVDILRIRLLDKPIEESEEVEPGVIVDYDERGQVVGLELLGATELVLTFRARAN